MYDWVPPLCCFIFRDLTPPLCWNGGASDTGSPFHSHSHNLPNLLGGCTRTAYMRPLWSQRVETLWLLCHQRDHGSYPGCQRGEVGGSYLNIEEVPRVFPRGSILPPSSEVGVRGNRPLEVCSMHLISCLQYLVWIATSQKQVSPSSKVQLGRVFGGLATVGRVSQLLILCSTDLNVRLSRAA